MTTVEVFAPAKINLTLHVTGQREDGYHLLDSLVVFADVGDRLTLSLAQKTRITTRGPFAAQVPHGHDNLVHRAADLIGVTADITLEKNLPVASGIGGGSADAAAAIRGLSKLYNLPLPDTDTLLSLGADIPVCVSGGVVRMSGIGEMLERIDDGPFVWPMVLVNPGVHISTPNVFAGLATKTNAPMDDPYDLGPEPHTQDSFVDWLARQRNDLEAPARAIAPAIGDVLEALQRQNGCQLARMSGSGATCFALFDHENRAREARDTIAANHLEWWSALSIGRDSS